MLRSGYRVKMRTWNDDRDTAEVVWFRVPRSRAWLPFPTIFWSRNWVDKLDRPNAGLGEQRSGLDVDSPPAWYRGHAPAPYVGGKPCGDPEVWVKGGTPGKTPEILTTAEGRCPDCDLPHIVAAGGIAFGSRSQQRGWRQRGEGGLVIGGASYMGDDGYVLADGGLQLGGTAPQGGGPANVATGGIAFGGVAMQPLAGVVLGEGGIAFGGEAVQPLAGVVLGEGGIAFGGASMMPQGGGQIGQGGIAFGGEADQTGEASRPRFVQAVKSALSSGTLPLDVPPLAQVGDLLIATGLIVGATATWTGPAGWAGPFAGSFGAGAGAHAMFTKTVSEGDPDSWDFDFTSDNQAIGAMTAIRYAGILNFGDPNNGTSGTMLPGNVYAPEDHCLVLWWGASAGANTTSDPPAGMTLADATMPGTEIVEFYAEDADSDDYDTEESDLATSDDWVAIQVAIQPL